MKHTMNTWERVVKVRLRREVTISEQQYGVMLRNNATDVIFAVKVFIEMHREGKSYILSKRCLIWSCKAGGRETEGFWMYWRRIFRVLMWQRRMQGLGWDGGRISTLVTPMRSSWKKKKKILFYYHKYIPPITREMWLLKLLVLYQIVWTFCTCLYFSAISRFCPALWFSALTRNTTR